MKINLKAKKRKHKEAFYVPLILYIDQSTSSYVVGRQEGLEDPEQEIMLIDLDVLESSSIAPIWRKGDSLPFDIIIRNLFYACEHISHDFDEYGQRWDIALQEEHHGLLNGSTHPHFKYGPT